MPKPSQQLKKNIIKKDTNSRIARVSDYRHQPDIFIVKKKKTAETQPTPRARGASNDSATKTQSSAEEKKTVLPPESQRLLMSQLEEKEKVKLIRAEEEKDRKKLTEFLLQPTKYFLNPNEQTYNQMTELLNSDQLGVGLAPHSDTTQTPQDQRHHPKEVPRAAAQKQNQQIEAPVAHQTELRRSKQRRIGLQADGPLCI